MQRQRERFQTLAHPLLKTRPGDIRIRAFANSSVAANRRDTCGAVRPISCQKIHPALFRGIARKHARLR
jgi:hypothetical protein